MKKYIIFTRTWWKENKEWPNGLEPHAGRKKVIGFAQTEEEAQTICKEWNAGHNPGRLSRKAEFDLNVKPSNYYGRN
jgi:hypothetical protein